MKYRSPLQILEDVGAVLTDGHFVYNSGKHGSAYVNKDALYPHVEATRELCSEIAAHTLALDPEVVIAPALGGIILSQWTAYQLQPLVGLGHEVLSVYAEKVNLVPSQETFILARGYDKLVRGKRALVVEDVLTTGGSIARTIEVARHAGANVVAAAALCNRGGITAEQLGVPELFSLTEVSLDSWDESECPLCRDNIPINTDVGHGRAFLQRK